MSVLKQKRTVSKTEYINKANAIYTGTLNMLSRLSARYSRLIGEGTMSLAIEVVSYCEKANNIYPSNELRAQMREEALVNARASLAALDVQLTHVYELCLLNPEGCFTTLNENVVSGSKAIEKLDNFSQDMGELIDEENKILTALLNK